MSDELITKIERKLDEILTKMESYGNRITIIETKYDNLKWIMGIGIGIIATIIGISKVL
jgi:hypothetical protein